MLALLLPTTPHAARPCSLLALTLPPLAHLPALILELQRARDGLEQENSKLKQRLGSLQHVAEQADSEKGAWGRLRADLEGSLQSKTRAEVHVLSQCSELMAQLDWSLVDMKKGADNLPVEVNVMCEEPEAVAPAEQDVEVTAVEAKLAVVVDQLAMKQQQLVNQSKAFSNYLLKGELANKVRGHGIHTFK